MYKKFRQISDQNKKNNKKIYIRIVIMGKVVKNNRNSSAN